LQASPRAFAPLSGAGFPAAPRRTWGLAAVIILMQILFSGALLWANIVAEAAPGRLVTSIAMASAGERDPVTLPDADFSATPLPVGLCCEPTPMVFRTRLTAADADLAAPAVLISSAHDNVWLYVDGDLVAGQGRPDATVTSRRPQLLRIPDRYIHPGARIDLVVTRTIGFGHLRPFHVGAYQDLYPSWLALRLLRSDLPFANAIIGAFVAAFCLCAAPLFGARGLLLSLAGLGGSWVLQHVGLMMSDPPWGALASAGIYLAAFLSTLIFMVWFFVEWTSVFAPPRSATARTPAALILDAWPGPARARLGLAALAVILVGVALIALRLQYDPGHGLQVINRILGWLGLATIGFSLIRIGAFYARGGLGDPAGGLGLRLRSAGGDRRHRDGAVFQELRRIPRLGGDLLPAGAAGLAGGPGPRRVRGRHGHRRQAQRPRRDP
jgi:hypothetical protein